MSPYVRSVPIVHGDRLIARAVLLILLGVYGLTFTGLPDVPDAEVEFQTTSAIARTGSAALGGTPEAALIAADGFGVREGEEGGTWSRYGIGEAVLAVPFYAVGEVLARLWPEIEERHARDTLQGGDHGTARSEYFAHLVVGLRNPLLAAITAWLVVTTVRRFEGGRKSAFIAGLSYGLCTFAWPQARSTLSDVQATFFVFLSFHLLVKMREEYERWRVPPRWQFLLCGSALAAALLTRVATGLAVGVLGLTAVGVCVRGRRWWARGAPSRKRAAVDFVFIAVPAALGLAAFLAFNHARFGDPLDSGYRSGFLGSFFNAPLLALAGLLVAPGRGLLWMAPGVLLLPIGLARARRQGEGLWPVVLVAVALAVVAPIAGTLWSGGWTYGPRYLLPLLPFLWVGVGLAFDRLRGARRRVAMAVLCSGLLVSLPGAMVDHMTHQELALQAARAEWPPEEVAARHGAVSREDYENAIFSNTLWSWHYAAPWAHWRILRHRVAGLGERYAASELYFQDDPDVVLEPTSPRARGWRHLALYDLSERLGGTVWPFVLLCLASIAFGVTSAVRGLDPTLR